MNIIDSILLFQIMNDFASKYAFEIHELSTTPNNSSVIYDLPSGTYKLPYTHRSWIYKWYITIVEIYDINLDALHGIEVITPLGDKVIFNCNHEEKSRRILIINDQIKFYV